METRREWLFVLLNKNTGLAGWWLMLRTPEELHDYLEATNGRYGRAFDNYMHDGFYSPHVTGHGRFIQEAPLTLAAYLHGVNQKTSIIDAIMDLANVTATNMLDAILSHGHIYVNKAGGYNWSGTYEQGDFVRSKTLVWPDFTEQDIRISRFPGGMHYYAHIGDTQISKDDKRRFWTYDQAKDAAMAYLLDR